MTPAKRSKDANVTCWHTLGLIRQVEVTAAGGRSGRLEAGVDPLCCARLPRLRTLWVDGGYAGADLKGS